MDFKKIAVLFLLVGIMVAIADNATATAPVEQTFWSQPNFNFVSLLLWTAGFCLLLPFGWFIGRMQDLNQRCKWMRWVLKKDYRLLEHKFKGSMTLYSRIVNVDDGVVHVGNKDWILAGKRMYLKSNQKIGWNISQLDKDPTYEDSCPAIFVDDDSFTPLAFAGDDTIVRPEEVGATYGGYLLNQLKKGLSAIKNIGTMLKINMGAALLCVILIYMIFTTVQDIRADQQVDHSLLVNMTNAKAGATSSGQQTIGYVVQKPGAANG